MSSSTVGKHAGSSAASNQPAVAEPDVLPNERVHWCIWAELGILSTLSRKQHVGSPSDP